MSLVTVEMKDPEIVGEFLQCLKILQFTPESDPELIGLFTMGVEFLIAEERERGSKGIWVTKKEVGNTGKWGERGARVYDRYHASYCAAIALLDYGFLEVLYAIFFSLSLSPASPFVPFAG